MIIRKRDKSNGTFKNIQVKHFKTALDLFKHE